MPAPRLTIKSRREKELQPVIIDAHCDTLSVSGNLFQNTGHLDIARAIDAGYSGQVFAAYGPGKIEQLRRLAQTQTRDDFRMIPAIEGCDEVESLSDIDAYAALGVRLLGLTWNNDNSLAGGCKGAGGGLTGFGRLAVSRSLSLEMLVDLSHSSPRTFSDVMSIVKGPVAVTHACCAALNPHRRNLTDDQLRMVAGSGGVIGICYYPCFLTSSGKAGLADIAAHIAHAVNIAGAEHVGLGSDFDGCDILPEGMEGVQNVPRLLEMLPYPDDICEKIAGSNWKRLLF